ncbi:hypothetical protein [Hyphomicrobium denitrificans]|uniref:hypothetical protein n=1 Tax=Hyphomicrobium denitrificans TaxID=53399 RepID=UPI001181C341|nr:hypothetical protein [Hyphomicrobium denitrificans]
MLSMAAGAEMFGVSTLPRRAEIPVSFQASEGRDAEEDAAGEILLSSELDDEVGEELSTPDEEQNDA